MNEFKPKYIDCSNCGRSIRNVEGEYVENDNNEPVCYGCYEQWISAHDQRWGDFDE